MRGFLQASPLPLHHHLLWYRITGVLGEGGFGITYAAEDTNLHHRVAIKEYFPRAMCARDTLLDVCVRDEQHTSSYEWGLRRFIDEARTLAHFRHPNIVQVRTAFEKNRTAYMVMDLEHGMTLEAAHRAGRYTTEAEILDTVGPLLHGLAQVHSGGFIHRDIKLENIVLRGDGTPVLVDFGSARHVLGTEERGLTALVTRGYAPFEQYAQVDGPLEQGPWCDIYSLAAALYVLITRRVPPDALSRAARLTAGIDDPLVPAMTLGSPRFSRELLTAVDHGLAFNSAARPRSIEAWLGEFPPTLPYQARGGVSVDTDTSFPHSPAQRLTTELSERPTIVAVAQDTPADGGAATTAIELAALSVLVLDDEQYFRSLLLRVLERLGIGVRVAAASGPEALRELDARATPIDVVLLDLRMPGMDGIEFLRELHQSPHRPEIVFLSGVDPELMRAAEEFARSARLRVLGSVRKPVEPDVLGQLLARHTMPGGPPVMDGANAVPTLSERELAAGLAEGRVIPYYQPKIRLRDRTIAGVETLARWRHEDGTVLGPGTFIPLAEQSGLIDELTLVLMRRAFAECGEWTAMGLAVDLAINLSAASFANLRLPDVIESLAAAEGISPTRIVLEVTERTVADDYLAMMNILVRLRLKGITLSIDDFGTGYSSLQQLHKLPFSELKIDRAFVSGAAQDARAHSILEASVQLGRKLGMTTIAEGVESESDLHVVTAAGCDIAQGYYFARPMPGRDFHAWALAHRARHP